MLFMVIWSGGNILFYTYVDISVVDDKKYDTFGMYTEIYFTNYMTSLVRLAIETHCHKTLTLTDLYRPKIHPNIQSKNHSIVLWIIFSNISSLENKSIVMNSFFITKYCHILENKIWYFSTISATLFHNRSYVHSFVDNCSSMKTV